MKTLVLIVLLALGGAFFAAPTAVAKPPPPQCIMEPCCAEGDIGCRVDWLRDELCRRFC